MKQVGAGVEHPGFPPSSRAGGRALWRSRVPLLMVVLAALLLGTIGYVALLAPRLWQSFTDPASSFSFRYPPGWLLTTDADGSHPTVIGTATHATITVAAAAETGTPQTLLADGLPSTATGLQHRQVAGADAIDFVVPRAQAGGSTAPDPSQLASSCRCSRPATKGNDGPSPAIGALLPIPWKGLGVLTPFL
jgi:hypothetical protein